MIAQLLRKIGWTIMLTLALLIVAYATFVLTTGMFPAPLRQSFQVHHVAITAHIIGAMVALALAPIQLLAWLRRRHIAIHRWLGRLAISGMLVGGLGGLVMSTVSYGGMASHLGFAGMALAWLSTAALGYRSIRARQIAMHRRWMIRNVALTLAAVTLRIWLPLLMKGAHMPFDTAYPIVAWLCWLPNLLIAEIIIRHSNQPTVQAIAQSGPAAS